MSLTRKPAARSPTCRAARRRPRSRRESQHCDSRLHRSRSRATAFAFALSAQTVLGYEDFVVSDQLLFPVEADECTLEIKPRLAGMHASSERGPRHKQRFSAFFATAD